MKILGFFYLYHLFFFLFSLALIRNYTGEPKGPGKSRLAVIIPAHNEENVIYDSVKSILKSDYPKDKYSIYVIADNCTDKTSVLAQAAGAKVLRREEKIKRGKQHALKWAFDQIDKSQYDGVIVLDADNNVDPGFLRVMDHHLSKGDKVIQGYLETKNPCDSWITANYSYIFWYVCRLQMARTRLNLSAWLGGTGLCISMKILEQVGWNVTTLVDDVEYTCQLILAGEKVTFAPGAVIYDQKPIGLKDSMRQRLRWIRGQTQVTFRYLPRLFWCMVKRWANGDLTGAARALDGVMWVPMQLIILGSFTASIFMSGSFYLLGVLISVPVFYILPLIVERIRHVRSWAYLITAGMFYFTWIPIIGYGVMTHGKKSWWRTPH